MAIMYRNEFDLEKQAITLELEMAKNSKETKYGYLWYKLKKDKKAKYTCFSS